MDKHWVFDFSTVAPYRLTSALVSESKSWVLITKRESNFPNCLRNLSHQGSVDGSNLAGSGKWGSYHHGRNSTGKSFAASLIAETFSSNSQGETHVARAIVTKLAFERCSARMQTFSRYVHLGFSLALNAHNPMNVCINQYAYYERIESFVNRNST